MIWRQPVCTGLGSVAHAPKNQDILLCRIILFITYMTFFKKAIKMAEWYQVVKPLIAVTVIQLVGLLPYLGIVLTSSAISVEFAHLHCYCGLPSRAQVCISIPKACILGILVSMAKLDWGACFCAVWPDASWKYHWVISHVKDNQCGKVLIMWLHFSD